MTKFVPTRDFILIRREEQKEKTAGGIFIPQNATEKPSEGEVLAVGSGVITKDGSIVPLEVKVGDKVLFMKHAAKEIKVGDEELILLREDQILGVFV